MGLSDWFATGTDSALALEVLRQELFLSQPTTSDGAAHMVPPGCSFIAHKTPQLGTAGDAAGKDGDLYTAVLAGPDTGLDELLAGSPEPASALMQERAALLAATRTPEAVAAVAAYNTAKANGTV
jgi:hypothetical protein